MALIILMFWNLCYYLLAMAIIITGLHGIIDIIKLYLQNNGNKVKWFFIDQFLHLTSIVIVWYFFFQPNIHFCYLTENTLFWLYITCFLFISVVTSFIIQKLLTNWSKQLSNKLENSLADAGKYIGILERFFIFIFVITNHWEAIGFLLAAKSVFRFGDLKDANDRKLTEYILIGTLLSFGLAIITGLIFLKLSRKIIFFE